jgi:hypothetical protein
VCAQTRTQVPTVNPTSSPRQRLAITPAHIHPVTTEASVIQLTIPIIPILVRVSTDSRDQLVKRIRRQQKRPQIRVTQILAITEVNASQVTINTRVLSTHVVVLFLIPERIVSPLYKQRQGIILAFRIRVKMEDPVATAIRAAMYARVPIISRAVRVRHLCNQPRPHRHPIPARVIHASTVATVMP